ncbi:MAG: hypothetical protein K1W13_10040 [Lachnospiraceae bacterium]
MNSYYGVFVLLLLFLFLLGRRRKALAAVHHMQKRKKETLSMKELAKRFLDRECIIYTLTSNGGDLQGTIKEVSEGGMLIEDAQGQQQAVNLEYVTRIREFPRNKKGKKKSLVLD